MRQLSRRLAVLATVGTVLIGTIGAPVARAAVVIHVPADHATIQGAIDAASPGDTVLVEAGSYAEHLWIGEEITVESADGPDVTVIDGGGDGGGAVVVLSALDGESPTIRGFTIQGGSDGQSTDGNGVLTSGGPALIEGNHIIGNGACTEGSGIDAAFSAATIKDNLIADNHQHGCTGGNGGGGISIRGAGSVHVQGNMITGNSMVKGGGIAVLFGGNPVIDGNVISDNHGAQGGGIWSTGTNVLITNNLFVGNSADAGGAIYEEDAAPIVNNTFVGNTAGAGSAVVASAFSPSTRIASNVVVATGAAAAVVCGGLVPLSQPVVANDVWNSNGPAYDGDCIGATGIDGNISVDPKFVDPTGDDYHLRPDSPLIDAGSDPDAPALDFDGDARPFDGDENATATTDIGFDESTDPLLVDPARLDFGSALQTVAVADKAVTLTNLGGGPLTITGLTIVGTNAADFSIGTQTCTAGPLAVSASCVVTVGFKPAGIGSREAALSITGATLDTHTVTLSGTGLDRIEVAPPGVDFGSVAVGVPADLKTVTLTNHGTVPLTISTITLGGADGVDFSIDDDTCSGSPIAATASCTISIGFLPPTVGARDASMSIVGADPQDTRTVSVTGSGFDSISVTPSGVSFGSVPTGSAATPQTVIMTNEGPAPVTVTTVTLGGTNPADFSIVSQTCTSGPIAATGTCSVTVGFTPKVAGPRSGSITLTGPTPVDDRVVAVGGAGGPPLSGVSWGTTFAAGKPNTWNDGGAVARTVQSGTQRLHVAYTTDRVGGAWSTNSSHRAGVYYVRSTSGSTYSTPKRLNPTSQTATRVALAASGARVYVAWVSQTKLTNVDPAAARVVYVRVNTSHGGGTHWRPTVRLSYTTTRADFPSVAASGDDAYVVWTRSDTGGIRVAISRNKGVSWIQKTIGSTGSGDASGRSGVPSVSVSGSTVAVAWISDSNGTVKAAVSTNRGKSWGTPVVVGSHAIAAPSVAVRGSRIALTWSTVAAVVVRQRISGAWGAPLIVADLSDITDPIPYAPTVVLQGTARIAVAWSEAPVSSDESDLRWVESANNGAVWYEAQTLAASTTSPTRRVNDWASVLWPSEGTRYVVWNGWTPDTRDYRLYLRKGSGTPIGPTSVAAVWPSSSSSKRTPASTKDTPGWLNGMRRGRLGVDPDTSG